MSVQILSRVSNQTRFQLRASESALQRGQNCIGCQGLLFNKTLSSLFPNSVHDLHPRELCFQHMYCLESQETRFGPNFGVSESAEQMVAKCGSFCANFPQHSGITQLVTPDTIFSTDALSRSSEGQSTVGCNMVETYLMLRWISSSL